MQSVLFSLAMAGAGIVYTGRLVFPGLIWNLFLAWIPYALSKWMLANPAFTRNRWKMAAGFAGWILFVPNSFYILTDIFHLGEMHDVPLWYHLLLLVSFAWNGIVLGVLSVRHMEKIITSLLGREPGLAFLYPVMWLNALGVYIGRYWRYNSWDVVTNPFALSRDIARMIFHPGEYMYAWGMVFSFSVFMAMIYKMVRKA